MKKLISINDIKVRDSKLSKYTYLSIIEHPYYLSLKNNNQMIYDKFITNHSSQRKKKTSTWNEFYKLYVVLKTVGFQTKYNKKDPIIIENNLCRHGRHRICMLKLIYGSNLIIELKDNMVYKLHGI